ncbi:MAG: ABC transporter permease [Thermoanaerobaculia bacterium]
MQVRAPLLAVSGALVLGAVLLLLTGHDPIAAYAALVKGALGGRGGANLMATLQRATPIVGMGLATAVALRAGFLNLGGEGQLVLGALAAALTVLELPLDGPILLPVGLLAGAVAGGLYAWLAYVLEARFTVPLLISTLLLNYPARYLASYAAAHPWRDVASGMSQTALVPEAARLPALVSGSRLHAGSLLIVVLVLAAAWVLHRTRVGYELRMTGLNADFARYGGVDVRRLGARVMIVSGGLAGLVGAIEVLAVHHRFIDGALTQPLYAWTGLMTALLAGSAPLGVLAAGLLFAGIQTGGFGMERGAGVPRELSRVIQALAILLVAAASRLRLVTTVARDDSDGSDGDGDR